MHNYPVYTCPCGGEARPLVAEMRVKFDRERERHVTLPVTVGGGPEHLKVMAWCAACRRVGTVRDGEATLD